MLYYSVLFICFFLVVLIFRIFRIIFHALAERSVALVDELLSDAEDETKIKLVQSSTNRLVVSLLKTLLLVLVALVLGSIPLVIYCLVTGTDYHSLDLASFYSILSISAGATLAIFIPYASRHSFGYSDMYAIL